MQMRKSNKVWSFKVCAMLIVAMALWMTGCGIQKKDAGTGQEVAQEVATKQESATEDAVKENAVKEDATQKEATEQNLQVLGEGKISFSFTVVDQEGKKTAFEIHTDKETVGDALQELELIAGDPGEFGLYVKTVNGITVDYEKDGKYWSFYVDGEYAQAGVDTTKITAGASYAFKVE